MYAVIRQYPSHPETAAQARQALAQAWALSAGYAGTFVVDDEEHLTAVSLWQTRAGRDGRA
jgi:hypothetical protein